MKTVSVSRKKMNKNSFFSLNPFPMATLWKTNVLKIQKSKGVITAGYVRFLLYLQAGFKAINDASDFKAIPSIFYFEYYNFLPKKYF